MKRLALLIALLLSMAVLVACATPMPKRVVIENTE